MILVQIQSYNSFGSSILFGIVGAATIGIVSSLHAICCRHAKPRRRVKGIALRSYHGISSIEVRNDLSYPKILNPDEVLIKVVAAGLETVDFMITQGYGSSIRSYLKQNNEHANGTVILGRECSGVVLETGRDVTSFFEGDEVWVVSPYCLEGLMVEYCVVKEFYVSLKPRNLTFEEAASLPYTAIQVCNAVIHQAKLNPKTTINKRILILAGNTPFGLFAMQLLKSWGGDVTTAVPTAGLPMSRVLKADDVIVYTVTDYEMELRRRKKFDMVINSMGTIVHPLCLDVCSPGGRVITFTTTSLLLSDKFGVFFGSLIALAMQVTAWMKKMSEGKLNSFCWDTLTYDREYLNIACRLVEENKVSPIIENVYCIDEAVYAFQQLAKYENVGKSVIRISS